MRCFFALLLMLSVCQAQDGTEQIRLPISKEVVTPAAITELTEESIFVIEADVPCIVLASRTGFVAVTPETGPLRIRGKFADGTKVETRAYTAKHLWIIDAVAKGEVELLIVPNGAKAENEVVRRTLIVSGSGPRPPTPPTPIPDPIPTPTPTPNIAGKRMLVVYESKDLTKLLPTQIALMSSSALRAYLNTHCEKSSKGHPEYNFWDKDVDLTNASAVWKNAMALPRDSLPWLYVSNGTTGYSGPLPKTEEELMPILKKYLGD